MRVNRSPAGEELNRGDVTEARQAASLILLRDSPDGPEVLLVQRNPEQRFMGGAWVFPGGAVIEGENDPGVTALRELEEEASVRIEDVESLVPFSRWITPEEVKVRLTPGSSPPRRRPAPPPGPTAASASTRAGCARWTLSANIGAATSCSCSRRSSTW